MEATNSSNIITRKSRGRKPKQTPDAPCKDCIQRASQSNTRGDVRFCDECARVLGHARRSLPELSINVRTGHRGVAQRAGIQKYTTPTRSAITSTPTSNAPARNTRCEGRARNVRQETQAQTARQRSQAQMKNEPGPGRQVDQAHILRHSVHDVSVQREGQQQIANQEHQDRSAFVNDEPQIIEASDQRRRSRESRAQELRGTLQTQGVCIESQVSSNELSSLPDSFVDLDQAYQSLSPVQAQLAGIILAIENTGGNTTSTQETHRSQCRAWLQLWEITFANFLSLNIQALSSGQLYAAMVLKAHQLIAECFSLVQLQNNRLDWTPFESLFRDILNLATEVVKDDATDFGNNPGVYSYQQTLPRINIFDPVFEVQLRTTDMELANIARSLLATISPRTFHSTPGDDYNIDTAVTLIDEPLLLAISDDILDIPQT